MMKRTYHLWLLPILTPIYYLASCYLIPGLRIKLAAPPLTYFLESLGSAMGFKLLVSILAASITCLIVDLVRGFLPDRTQRLLESYKK